MAQKANRNLVAPLLVSHKNAGENSLISSGLYINGDLFGLFVMPLTGVDWQINSKTNLFGVLPGNMTLEHELKKKHYTMAELSELLQIHTRIRVNTGVWMKTSWAYLLIGI